MTVTPAENARLLGWVPVILGAKGTQGEWELNFLRGIRSRHKKNPALVLKDSEVRWLGPIVARFLADGFGGDEAVRTEGEGRDGAHG